MVALMGIVMMTRMGNMYYDKKGCFMDSKRFHIKNPEMKKLSEQIIEGQEKEIAEMKPC